MKKNGIGKLISAYRRHRFRSRLTVLTLLLLAGCSAIHPLISHQRIARNLHAEDRDDLSQGNLLSIRDRFEQRGIGNLDPVELAVLCDVYIKHLSLSKAAVCLDTLKTTPAGSGSPDRIKAKEALVAFLAGQYERAVALTDHATDDGARYVRALALTRLGNRRAAIRTARQWALNFDPEHVYLAASLFLASGQYKDAMTVLMDPERRLARDYSLSGGKSAFGRKINPAPLRIDLFDEFGFGLLDTYSYAPAANVYVEFMLARCEMELGDRESARSRLDTILAYPNITAYREIFWRALFERGRLSEMEGNPIQAIAYYKRAIALIEGVRASISTEAGRIGFVGDKQVVYHRLVQLLVATGDAQAAFSYTERSRSRALVDVLATQRQFGGRPAALPGMQGAFLDFERAESRVLELEGAARPAALKRSAQTYQAEKNRLMRGFPMLADLVTVNRANAKLETILPHVSTDETLLCYFKADRQWYVFVLTRSPSNPIRCISLDMDNPDGVIRSLRRRLEQDGGRRITAESRQLYEKLIRPVAGSLKSNLTIVPYGVLHYLPFAALNSGSHFLVDTHTLRVLPSAEVLMVLPSTLRPSGSMLALGNPLGDLEGTEREVRRVAEAHQPSKVLIGPSASRTNFQRLAPAFDILHIAAHGEYVQEAPLESRLILAPSEGDAGDLTVRDLYAMQPPLRASITVLSACESALSQIASGDELIGLQRGFLFAGTESIVGSLWRVSDAATAYLMEQFYRSLGRNVSRAKALQEAQVKTRREYPNHGDWAAFIYTGAVH